MICCVSLNIVHLHKTLLCHNMDSPQYDIVVFGATGFTGTLISEYLAYLVYTKAKWGPTSDKVVALAGRSAKKLEQLVDRIKKRFGGDIVFDTIVADAEDAKAVEEVVSKTKVLIGAAGPFTKYGSNVVEACALRGVQYCDITGETSWNRVMIDKYHQTAIKNNALIVSFCGCDSIPFDLATLMLVEHIKQKYNCGTGDVQLIAQFPADFTPSGGTFQTMLTILGEGIKPEAIHPYALNPRDDPEYPPMGKVRPQDKDSFLPFYDSLRGRLYNYFIMSSTNTKVVRRSWRLYKQAGFDYGSNFAYRSEYQDTGSFLSAILMTIMLVIFTLLAATPFTNQLLKKYGIQAGDGPSPAKRDRTRVTLDFYGKVDHPSIDKTVKLSVTAGDIGYTNTAEMAVESALILAYRKGELNTQGGVVTPAFAFGSLLARQLTEVTPVKFRLHDSK